MTYKIKTKNLISTFGSKELAIKSVDEILNISRERGMYISNDAEQFYKEVKKELLNIKQFMKILAWQCYWCGSINSPSNKECGNCKKHKKTTKQF